MPDRDKYLKVEQFKVNDRNDLTLDKKLMTIILNLKCLENILHQYEKEIVALQIRLSNIKQLVVQNNHALLLTLGEIRSQAIFTTRSQAIFTTRSQAIFTEFDDDDNFENAASLFSTNRQEIEVGLIEARIKSANDIHNRLYCRI